MERASLVTGLGIAFGGVLISQFLSPAFGMLMSTIAGAIIVIVGLGIIARS